jgi:iron complex transport system substrate-binding protein
MASKRMMIIAVLVAAVVIVAAAAVALSSGNKNSTGGSATVVDALDRTITTNATPVRIVSCAPSITEMVYALGSGNSLAAVTDYCDYPSQVVARKENQTLGSIGSYKNPSFDNIVAKSPDLVILIRGAEGHDDMANQLDRAHIPNVILYECDNITLIYNNLHLLGDILHAKSAADSYVSEMKAKITSIQTRVASQGSAPKVMFAIYPKPIYVAGSDTFNDDVITIVGGVNCFGNLTGYQSASKEAVLAADPDVIIVTAMATNINATKARQDMISDPQIGLTKAAQSGRIYVLTNMSESIFLRPGIRVTDGVGLIAHILYPSVFEGTVPYWIASDYQAYLPSYN